MTIYISIIIVLVAFSGFLIHRDYRASQMQKKQAIVIKSAKRSFLEMNQKIEMLAKANVALAGRIEASAAEMEASRQFAEKAALDLQFLRDEFQVILAYRKTASNFDHMEGL